MSRDVSQEIQETIDAHPVVLFMKGTPTSMRILRPGGRDSPPRRSLLCRCERAGRSGCSSGNQGFLQLANHPQLYVNGEFLGGCDITRELFQTGDLQAQLEAKGLIGSDSEEGQFFPFPSFIGPGETRSIPTTFWERHPAVPGCTDAPVEGRPAPQCLVQPPSPCSSPQPDRKSDGLRRGRAQ